MKTKRDLSGIYFMQRLPEGGHEPRCFEDLEEEDRERVLAQAHTDELLLSLAQGMIGELMKLIEYATKEGAFEDERASNLATALILDRLVQMPAVTQPELQELCRKSADALYGLAEALDVTKASGE